jgi:hypothetical protein
MSRLVKFLDLTRREKAFFLEAAIWLIISNLTVRIVAFKYIEGFLRGYCWRPGDNHVDVAVDRNADISLVNLSLSRAANQFPWQTLCLSRSIAAFVMLERRGIPVVMFVGAKFIENASLCAHAWVHAGHVGFDEDATFTPLLTIGQRK